MKFVPLTVQHFKVLDVQDVQRAGYDAIDIEDVLARSQYAAAALVGDMVVAIGGIIEIHPHRATGWTFLSKNAGPHMLRLTRMVNNYLRTLPYARVEATADVDFEHGHKWLRLLGFDVEAARMAKFGAHGEDHALYSRIS